MEVKSTSLKGVFIIEFAKHQDARGFFTRSFCLKEIQKLVKINSIVQVNQSFSKKAGTLRGLHFQKPPFEEVKIVKCLKGAVVDVVVDIRKDSETFLQYEMVHLSEKNQQLIIIPEGFAHGFQTLENNTELLYFHSQFYSPESEGGLHFNDPKLKVCWPKEITTISERDKRFKFLESDFKGI